jgi:hypothetical protein
MCLIDFNVAPIKGSVFFIFKKRSNSLYPNVHIDIYSYLCMFVCMFVCMYVCMLDCIYVCMYVCIYVCICMYCIIFYILHYKTGSLVSVGEGPWYCMLEGPGSNLLCV